MKILAFAGAREKAGFAELEAAADPSETPRAILGRVAPQLAVANLRAAIDCEYWDWDAPIGAASELAIIPPVNGG
jgi:molybdopterin converting factor small subunit